MNEKNKTKQQQQKNKTKIKLEVAPPGLEPAPQLPSEQNVPFNLFKPCGAIFIMNSKIHVKKNSLNDYSKPISLYFRVYPISGFIWAAR